MRRKLQYIKYKDQTFINKELGEPIIESSFLVRLEKAGDIWVRTRENEIINFARSLDGYTLEGYMGKYEKHKIKSKNFNIKETHD